MTEKLESEVHTVLVYKSGLQYCDNPSAKQVFTDTQVSQKATC